MRRYPPCPYGIDLALARDLADLPAEDFARLLTATPDPDARIQLWRARLRYRDDEFCRYFWPERFNLPFNELHYALFAEHQETPPWYDRAGTVIKSAVAAPRGYAKSTIKSFAELVHDIVYDREAYILLLTAGQRLSLSLARDLRQQFKPSRRQGGQEAGNERLARLYGPFELHGSDGEWEVKVRGRESVGILARSFDTEVRGAKHPTRGIRVTKGVIDDGESKDHVRNPDQRLKLKDNLNKDVLKTGAREGGTVYNVVGTVLHPDSMLNNLLADPGWRSSRWKAIKKWPVNSDLWEQCRLIWVDLTLGKHRRTAAKAFFEAHRETMEEGSELLDPASRTLFDLHEIIWSEGLGAFLCELQNEPVDPTRQIFFSDRFARFTVKGNEIVTANGRHVPIATLRKFGHWDPATGSVHGDYAAIAIIGRDGYGYSYVLDCWMRRAKPSEQMQAAWTLGERWDVARMHVEGGGFQDLVTEPYRKQREERRKKDLWADLQVLPVTATQNKELRIASLEPDITNHWIQFSDKIPQDVLGQFDQFPTGDHDDGPDAIHGAWVGSGGRSAHMVRGEQ